MPHDKRGVLLQPGDKVRMEFTVKEVHPGAETCNVSLVRLEPEEQQLYLTCQAKQVEKID